MKPLAHVLFALVLVALQSAVLRWAGGGAYSVLLLAGCVVYLGLHGGNVEGSVGAAGIGYVLDLVNGSPKGLMTFLAVLLFLVVRSVNAGLDVRGRGGFALLSGAGALVLSLGALVLTRLTSPAESAPGLGLLPRMIVEAVLTALAAPLLYSGLRLVDRVFHREEHGLLR